MMRRARRQNDNCSYRLSFGSKSWMLVVAILYGMVTMAQTTTDPGKKLDASAEAHDLQKATMDHSEQLINVDHSGDMNFALPLINAEGRKLSLPVNINYTAGIKAGHYASEVGLGWCINFGSIVRDYGAFEPDYSATAIEATMSNSAGCFNDGWLSCMPLTDSNGILLSASHFSNPLASGKDLRYTGLADSFAVQMTPDLYRLSIPGAGSNAFWNNGNPGDSHAFKLTQTAPWRISHTTKTFTITQEYSRINNYNFSGLYEATSDTCLATNGSYAAAIAIPPYVNNRYFKRNVEGPPAGSNAFYPAADERKVTYEDFSSFVITTGDGTQYVFGRPLRGQKYLFSEDPYWSSLPYGAGNNGSEQVKGEFWKIDFIAEWLLTEVRSHDYQDLNNNGRADIEDAGDWIRIEYTEPLQIENSLIGNGGGVDIEVPRHREWKNFSNTDRASSLMCEKAYVTKIVTPLHEYHFSISQRFDIDHDYFEIPFNNFPQISAAPASKLPFAYADIKFHSQDNDHSKLKVHYPVETMRYDKIEVKDATTGTCTGSIRFNYAERGSADELCVSKYVIRDNDDKPKTQLDLLSVHPESPVWLEQFRDSVGRGKTTLLSVEFFPEEIEHSSLSEIRKYTFEYGFNPSYDEIHKRHITGSLLRPSLRQAGPSLYAPTYNNLTICMLPYRSYEFKQPPLQHDPITATLSFYPLVTLSWDNAPLTDLFGYYLDSSAVNFGRDAWSMTRITMPGKGTVTLEYERDRFDYLGDRAGWSGAGALIDDHLPFIDHYNKVAIMRSLLQSRIGGTGAIKSLYRTFSMPMNDHSGGLRLKSKTLNDGVNTPVIMNYIYGSGHYQAVPASYWSNYIVAFSDFLKSEQLRHETQGYYAPALPSTGMFYKNDFTTYMSKLAINIRVDNTINDNHYYEYIAEVYPDGAKRISYYGTPDTTVTVYRKQQCVHLKGFTYHQHDLVEMITNDNEQRYEPVLKKIELFEAAAQTPYESIVYDYILVENDVKYNSYKSNTILPVNAFTFPIYENHDGYMDEMKLVFNPAMKGLNILPQDHILSLSSAQMNTLFDRQPVTQKAIALNDYILQKEGYQGVSNTISTLDYKNFQAFKDEMYHIDAYANAKRYQTVFKAVESVTRDDEGLLSITHYSYDHQTGLTKSETVLGSTVIVNGLPETTRYITTYNYAFETTPYWSGSMTNIFLERNMMHLKSQTSTYLNSVLNSNLVHTVVQQYDDEGRFITTWNYRVDVDDRGRFLSYHPFQFNTPEQHPDWFTTRKIRTYNKYGTPIITADGLVTTRMVPGLRTNLPVAEFSWTDKWFDAAYSGFEEMRGSERVWVDIKTLPVIATQYTGALSNISPCQSSVPNYQGKKIKIFVSEDSLLIGDRVRLVNTNNNASDFNKCYFETSVAAVINDIPEGTNPIQQSIIDTYYGQYTYSICFADPLPAEIGVDLNSLSLIKMYPTDQFVWQKIPGIWKEQQGNPQQQGVSDIAARTGNYSYMLRGQSQQSVAVTPVTTLELPDIKEVLKGFDGENAAQMKYIASFWAKKAPGSLFPAVNEAIIIHCCVKNDNGQVIQNLQQNVPQLSDTCWEKYTYEFDVTMPYGGNDAVAAPYSLEIWISNNTNAGSHCAFFDDILIYPKGARYSYATYNHKGKKVAATDANENTSKRTYDAWGREIMQYDAKGNLLRKKRWFTTKNIAVTHNYTETTTYFDQATKLVQRNYSDGFGKPLQVASYEPSKNTTRIENYNEYDYCGRVIKTYNTIAFPGSYMKEKALTPAVVLARARLIYGNGSYPYVKYSYYARPGARVKTTTMPGQATEPAVMTVTSRSANQSGVPDIFGNSYPAGALMEASHIDPLGNLILTYSDKRGLKVAEYVPKGYEHVQQPNGAIVFDSLSNYQHIRIRYLYDAMGRLVRTVDGDNIITSYTYNSAGELMEEDHPDKGVTQYRYDRMGRLRFVKDALNTLSTAANAGDEYKFYCYDRWGRRERVGLLNLQSFAQSMFNDTSMINNLEYPLMSDGAACHNLFLYDDAVNGIGKLAAEVIHSGFQYNQNGMPIPQHEDTVSFDYDKNGLVATKYYNLSGLQGVHRFENVYNRQAKPVKVSYIHPADPVLNFSWHNNYDENGLLVEALSSNQTNLISADAKYRFDPLGNLARAYLSLDPDLNDTIGEVISYRYNIRQQLTEQVAESFRYQLDYNAGGNITGQLWSNCWFDNTTFQQGVNQWKDNYYAYSYDDNGRLIGADKKTRSSDNNPWAGYDAVKNELLPWVSCVPVILSDMSSAIEHADSIWEQFTALGYEFTDAQQEAMDGFIALIEQEMIAAGTSFNMLSVDEQEAIISEISNAAEVLSIDLAAVEAVYRAVVSGEDKNTAMLLCDMFSGASASLFVDSLLITIEEAGENIVPEMVDLLNEITIIVEEIANKMTFSWPDLTEEEQQVFVDEALHDIQDRNIPYDDAERMYAMVHLNDFAFTEKLLESIGITVTENCTLNYNALAVNGTYAQNPVNTIWYNDTPFDAAYWYYPNGNIDKLVRNNDNGIGSTYLYGYEPAANMLIAVQHTTGQVVENHTLSYNATGDLTADPLSQTDYITYDHFSHLPAQISKANGPVLSYRYNSAEMRIAKEASATDKEFYLDGIVLDASGVPKQYAIEQGYAYINIVDSSLVKKYYLKDWLGTIRMVINDDGTVSSARDHYPYGTIMPSRAFESDSEGKRYQFTGHEFDDETGYEYHGARYYNRELGRYFSVDPLANSAPGWSSYNAMWSNPISNIDPDGRWADNYTIFSDGTISKEETDDNTNTYTYVNIETNEVVEFGTFDKVTNSKGEDMIKVGDEANGENEIFKWSDITSGNLYFEEDAFSGLLGGTQNFYDNAGENVGKVQFNQFMSLNRVHSGKGNRTSALDVAYYKNDGTTGALTTDKDISDKFNTQLLSSFKTFGLGSKAVYTSISQTSNTPYLKGTTGLRNHHHHFHFEGFNNDIGIQLPKVTIYDK